MVLDEHYQVLAKIPHKKALITEWSAIDHHVSFGADDVGLMDKAWWGMFCIVPDGLLNTDHIIGLGDTETLGTQNVYYNVLHGVFAIYSSVRVPQIAKEIDSLDESSLRDRYFALLEPPPKPKGLRGWFAPKRHCYAEFVSDQDFEYVMGYIESATTFFREAAERNSPVVFDGST